MARKSVSPVLSELQKNILSDITKRRDSPQHLVKRVKIVLLTAQGNTNKNAAEHIQVHSNTVLTWRHRWLAQQENLRAIEAQEDEKALKDFIVNVVLADDSYTPKDRLKNIKT